MSYDLEGNGWSCQWSATNPTQVQHVLLFISPPKGVSLANWTVLWLPHCSHVGAHGGAHCHVSGVAVVDVMANTETVILRLDLSKESQTLLPFVSVSESKSGHKLVHLRSDLIVGCFFYLLCLLASDVLWCGGWD